jgi:zinc transport system substrate-binding protein
MDINGKIRQIVTINIIFAILVIHSSAAAEKLTVYVVNYPLQYFAERIGGEHINAVFPAPADIDPAYWMPDAKTISDYQQADLILLNGAGYAKWINKATLPRFRMVNTSAGFKDQYLEAAEILTHSHGSEGKHAHKSLAFTTWIDFSLAARQAKAITQAFSRKRPELKDAFQKNYDKLEQDLLKLDRNLKTQVSKNPARPLIVSHPVYDYFARRYGLNIKSVHWEPGEIPTNEQMMELNRILKEHPAPSAISATPIIGEIKTTPL